MAYKATVFALLVAVCVLGGKINCRKCRTAVVPDTTDTTDPFRLTVMHVNDVHARFEETDEYSGPCLEDHRKAQRCYGGFARIRTAVASVRNETDNSVFLAAGDYYQGTVWYTVHRHRAMSLFVNMLGQDAMSLGNHEFDDGIDGLVPFLENATFPVLAANIDDSLEPSIQGKYAKSVVLKRSGRRIGIVGYLTKKTMRIASTGRLNIKDEIAAVRGEAQRLKAAGVNIIIGLGHAGYDKDVELARAVVELDLVVGGHTNTFMYSGDEPSSEKASHSYPSVVTRDDGTHVPVVQAYAFGKYLGRLDVTFDASGHATSWNGNPILLNASIEQDADLLSELGRWKKEIQDKVTEEIGKTYVLLDGTRPSCRLNECNLGNLEADAIVNMNIKYPDDLDWAHTSLAVVGSGGIRSSIDEQAANGIITMKDVLKVAPYQNTIDIVELRGRDVKQMFEHAVKKYDASSSDPSGHLLQVSGFTVTYNVSRPAGDRLVGLRARCVRCRVPRLEEVKDCQVYKVAMTSYLAGGGAGYTVVKDKKIRHHLTGLLDSDVYTQYIRQQSPIHQGVEDRIIFV